MLLSIAAIGGLAPSTAGERDDLPRHDPVMVTSYKAGDRHCRERSVVPEIAREIEEEFEAREPADTYSVGCIYDAPGSALYLLTGNGPASGEQFGLRFFLVRHDRPGLTILQQSHGMQDSWYLRPVFYPSGDRTLILAETGAEESWGVVAFELHGTDLRDLGYLEVAEDAGEFTINPLPAARVRLINGIWSVEFDVDLVWNPGGGDERPLPRRNGKPHLFRNDSGQFALVLSDAE
jgi:hypothetical protein